METVQQKGEVGGTLGRNTVVLETGIFGNFVIGLPFETKRRIGYDSIESDRLDGVAVFEHGPVVGEGITVEYLELRVVQAVEQHVHTGQVEGSDLLFLSINLADLAAVLFHLVVHVEKQGTRAACKVQYAGELFFVAGGRVLAVERDDAGEDSADLLRSVELASLFATARCELTDEILVSIAEDITTLIKFDQLLFQLGDDIAHHLVPRRAVLAKFLAIEVDLGKEAFEGALEGFFLYVAETVLEFGQKGIVLGAGQLVDCAPKVLGLDDIVRTLEHHILELRDVRSVLFIPNVKGFVFGQVASQFQACSRFVSGTDIAVEEEREHIVAEVVGRHSSTKDVGHVPKGPEKLLTLLLGQLGIRCFFHFVFCFGLY